MTIAELKQKNIAELSEIARGMEIPGVSGMRKQELLFRILQTRADQDEVITGEGAGGRRLFRRHRDLCHRCGRYRHPFQYGHGDRLDHRPRAG